MSEFGRTGKTSTSKWVSSVWNFPDKEPAGPYRWYGTLPRALTDQIVNLYGQSGSTIEPFGGTATAAISAATRGQRATALDVNPLALLVAKARSGTAPTDAEAESLIRKLGDLVGDEGLQQQAQDELVGERSTGALAYTEKWFNPTDLLSVWALQAALRQLNVAPWAWATFASTVKDMAQVDPRCTHHLVRKAKPPQSALEVFERRLEAVDPGWFAGLTNTQPTLVQGSFEEFRAPAELVVAHPPYEGVIHYHGIHRLATDLLAAGERWSQSEALNGLSFDYEHLRSRDASTDNSARYRDFVGRFSTWATESVASEGRLVLVIGDSRHQGFLRHPFSYFILDLEERGFRLEENFIWLLQHNAGMHVLRRANFIDHNYILVFRRP